jgi:hypothetical protein
MKNSGSINIYKKYISAIMTVLVLLGAVLPLSGSASNISNISNISDILAVSADNPIDPARTGGEGTRINSVIPYVTKTENGVARYVPIESREDIVTNPHSVSLRIQVYVDPADSERYPQIYIFKLRPHQETAEIKNAQPAASFDVVRNNEGFTYNVSLLFPDLSNLKSGEINNKFVAGIRESDNSFTPVSNAQYINNINVLSDRRAVPPVPNTKKGLVLQMPGEARLFGVEHTTVNLFLNDFMAAEEGPNTEIYSYGGIDYHFNIDKISEYDKIIKYFTTEGIKVTAVLLIDAQKFTPSEPPVLPDGGGEPEEPGDSDDPDNPDEEEPSQSAVSGPRDPIEYLIHPNALASGQSSGIRYYGVNAATEDGVRHFEALMSFIADRYVREDDGFGRIYNIILGRDIGALTLYNNCGRIDIVSYAENYLRALRIADTAMRSRFGGARVYVPFDNYFAGMPEESRDFINKDIINRLLEYSVREGNFIWNIAWSANNYTRLNPETWREIEPVNDFSTHVITMKNINVLCDYINTEKINYLPGGERRKIMLRPPLLFTRISRQGITLIYRRLYIKGMWTAAK